MFPALLVVECTLYAELLTAAVQPWRDSRGCGRIRPIRMGKQILLLSGALSYRNNAFLDAAARLGLDVIEVVDLPRALADLWHMPLAVPFSQPDLALPIIVDHARQYPVQAVLATDDTGSLLAAGRRGAGPAAQLTAGALAARNKHLMRQLFAAAGTPSPQSVRYDLDADPVALAAQLRYPWC
ncbi:hypothetical protein [Candidatus Amarolinea dominans]|uniref:hypothetical protein n=1 Tax=Candidatus Amarolinea dominans TaxID=3140696 RepID=UPI0031CC6766